MNALRESVKDFAERAELKALPADGVSGVRTPKGIKKALKRLGRIWREHPELKLGELLAGPYNGNYITNIRFIGDGALLSLLEEHYAKK